MVIENRTGETFVIKTLDEERIYDRDLELLRSFGSKHKGAKLFGFGAADQQPVGNVKIVTWERLG